MLSRALPLLLLSLLACKGDDKKAEQPGKAVSPNPADPKQVGLTAEQIEAEKQRLAAKQHTGGMERFKEPGVYVDGHALGALKFGELPITLKPVWHEERAAVSFRAGDTGPRFKIVKQRRYRFLDYYREMGVDVDKIKEMHMYGGNQRAAAVVITGDEIRKHDDFLFRFGGSIWGKPLPACPAGIGDGKCPDQIGSVAIYVDKEPPKREGGHFYFEGVRVKGIPYQEKPIRGGVRVYFDGPIAATVKRKELVAADLKSTGPADKPTYKLLDFLKLKKLDTDKIQEAWLVHYDRRVMKLSRAEILEATFTASPNGGGEILVGPQNTPTHVISFHSEIIDPKDLPVLTPDEIEKADG